MKFTANETIFIPDGKLCGTSDCLPLDEGVIFAVWARECEGTWAIMGALRDAKGRWEAPRQLTAADGKVCREPVLYRRADGSIMLLYRTGCPCCGLHTEYIVSNDGALTFGESHVLVTGDKDAGGPSRGKIIELSDGTLLAGGNSSDGECVGYVYRSEDKGESWTRSAPLVLHERYKTGRDNLDGFGLLNPVLWSEGGNDVHALLRSTAGFVFRADSADGGRNWNTPYPLNVPNGNSSVDVAFRKDLSVFMLCNPTGIPEGKTEGKRTPLALMQSNTNGCVWKRITVLASGTGDFSSPSMRLEAGKLYITYTVNKTSIQFAIVEL